ncbi:MAG TPA: TIGR03087 family PEP-CTERM/XrtA system glycosyltransferase, partial [Azospirillum sp.]
MREILFLAHRIPYPPNKGDKIRSWHTLRHLAARHRVHLGCFVDDPDDLRHVPMLRALCGEVLALPLAPMAARLRCLRGLLTGEPLTLAWYGSARMAAWTRRVLRERPVDAVVVFSSAMAPFAAVPEAEGCARILDMVDVDSEKWRQYAATRPWPLRAVFEREGRTLLAAEREAAAAADAVLFVSPAEADLFRTLAPESAARVLAVENGVDHAYFAPGGGYPDPFPAGTVPVVFTGAMSYWPNADAAEWFAGAVLPAVAAAIPGVRFYVVGANPGPSVRALERAGPVEVTGTVADVRPYLAHARAVVAPLRVARGVQNKVLEAMAMGCPVLATPEAAEGIDAVSGVHFRVAARDGF